MTVPSRPTTVRKDGRDWRVGTPADVAWITGTTTISTEITSAIPPVYDDYATILIPEDHDAVARHVDLILRHLRARSDGQPWWLGYLETGADGDVLPGAPRTTLYAGWHYALALAGPDEAASWRRGRGTPVDSASARIEARSTTAGPSADLPEPPAEPMGWRDPGPDLIFPEDRSWLLSWLWDDDWRCIGGSHELIEAVLDDPELETRRVRLGEDATPPGHMAM